MRPILSATAIVVLLGAALSGQQVASPAVSELDSLLPDPALREAVRLATEGQGDSARAVVRRHMRALSPSDALYPATLFAAGLVAESGDSATAYFRRVSIEFSRSDWADEALLRMAELAYAGGELGAAARLAERILLDYPFSSNQAKAAYWAGRSRVELGETDVGCAHLRRARDDAANDVELGNRAGYYLQRCGEEVAAADSAQRTPQTGAGAVVYSVQVAAVQSAAAADELMQRLYRAGFDAHVVRDADGLLKVRVGRFPRRAEAQDLIARLRQAVGGQPFVVEERR